jgi:hypothetical protein
MVKLKITQLSNKSIALEFPSSTQGSDPVIQYFPAQLYADASGKPGEVTIYKDEMPYVAFAFNEIEVNEHVPASVGEAVILLNEFIGNFNRAGGTASINLDAKADKILTPHINWNPANFHIPAGRTLKFNRNTEPKISGTELPAIAMFSIVNGNSDLMLGFYSNDSGVTTQAGLFHVNGEMTAFVPDVLLYDGEEWLNEGGLVLPYDMSGDFNEYIGIDTELKDFDLNLDITVPDIPAMNLTDVRNELLEQTGELQNGVNAALTEITQEAAARLSADDFINDAAIAETAARESGDNDLQSQIDAMQGQTRRFFIDFNAEFGTDTPTISQTDAWLAARTPALTPNVGTAFKNSNSTQSTYNHLFVYYIDPIDSEQLVLSDDGVDTVSTASESSLGVVRGGGDVRIGANGDMLLKDSVATDAIIGNRTLTDNAGNATLVPVAAKGLTAWLQGLRDNVKALFANKVDKTAGANKVYGTDSSGEQTAYDKNAFGTVSTVNGVSPDADKNVKTENYSLDETKVGTWIDGKPVYRKTITGTLNKPDAVNKAIQTDVVISNTVQDVIKMEGCVFRGSSKWMLPYIVDYSGHQTAATTLLAQRINVIGYRDTSNNTHAVFTSSSGHLSYFGTNDGVECVYYVTVYYTKTTD